MTNLAQTNHASLAEAIAQSPDWRTAVQDAIEFLIASGKCFSSGEIARGMRETRPDLKFSILSVGEDLRDRFYNQGFPCYADGSYPTQVHRVTEGLYPDRTPAGITVFVYGPDASSASAHAFEVFIPLPHDTAQDIAYADANPASPTPVPVLTPTDVSNALQQAYVYRDGRLCIPRKIVDGYLRLSNQVVDGNTKVFVQVKSGQVFATLEPILNAEEYSIWHGSGKIAIYPKNGVSWNPGDKFSARVDAEGITITL